MTSRLWARKVIVYLKFQQKLTSNISIWTILPKQHKVSEPWTAQDSTVCRKSDHLFWKPKIWASKLSTIWSRIGCNYWRHFKRKLQIILPLTKTENSCPKLREAAAISRAAYRNLALGRHRYLQRRAILVINEALDSLMNTRMFGCFLMKWCTKTLLWTHMKSSSCDKDANRKSASRGKRTYCKRHKITWLKRN